MGAMETGMMLIPQALTVAAVMPIAGRIFDRFGPRVVLIPGMILLAFSTYQFHNLDLGTSNLTIISWMMLRGVGMGLGMMPATTASMNAVPRQLIPRATALTNALQRISGSFGTAIMATVLTTRQGYQFAMASQTVTVNSPGFQMVMGRARTFASVEHLSAVVMQKLSFAMIYGQVAQFAAVRAIDDTFFVASVICIPAVLVALIVRNTKAASGAGPRPVLSE
jgi:MFS family permease